MMNAELHRRSVLRFFVKRIYVIFLLGLMTIKVLPLTAQEIEPQTEVEPIVLTRGLKVTDQRGEPVLLYKESHALIIGISNYTNGWPELPGVKKDVEDVKTVLESHGFNVVVKMDLDKVGLDQAFSRFISQYGGNPENRLVFYFAGHGHTVKTSYGEELGYIVPVNAPNPHRDVSDFQRQAVEMQQIEIYAKRIQSKHALFLFDACFSGSLFALSRAVPEIIGYKTAQPVRQFITSGSADETVPDESIFRAQFARALQGEADSDGDSYVTGMELGEFLQTTVVNYSRNAQHPQYGKIRNPNLDKGDFVFKLPEKQEEETTPAPVRPPEVTSSFDDLEVQGEWQEYLSKMEEAFSTVNRYEKLDILAKSKIAAWERFVQAFSEDNPYSTRDEELRSTAEEQITFWKKSLLPTETPVSVAGQKWTEFVTGMEFVYIPGGCFQMGCVSGIDCDDDEKPVHEVCLDGFWIGKYEVTQAQWQTIMGNNSSHFTGNDRPVESISWNNTQEFIKKLKNRSGTHPQPLPGWEFRLPSEAEWEYAARAGTMTAYSFGNDSGGSGEYAWYGSNSGSKTHSVGTRKPNAWGLYDMHGNVWEWCQDIYSRDAYQNHQRQNPLIRSGGSKRVLRGGSWSDASRYVRSAFRNSNAPSNRSVYVGLRLVRMK